jgi:hypothetical protein
MNVNRSIGVLECWRKYDFAILQYSNTPKFIDRSFSAGGLQSSPISINRPVDYFIHPNKPNHQ